MLRILTTNESVLNQVRRRDLKDEIRRIDGKYAPIRLELSRQENARHRAIGALAKKELNSRDFSIERRAIWEQYRIPIANLVRQKEELLSKRLAAQTELAEISRFFVHDSSEEAVRARAAEKAKKRERHAAHIEFIARTQNLSPDDPRRIIGRALQVIRRLKDEKLLQPDEVPLLEFMDLYLRNAQHENPL